MCRLGGLPRCPHFLPPAALPPSTPRAAAPPRSPSLCCIFSLACSLSASPSLPPPFAPGRPRQEGGLPSSGGRKGLALVGRYLFIRPLLPPRAALLLPTSVPLWPGWQGRPSPLLILLPLRVGGRRAPLTCHPPAAAPAAAPCACVALPSCTTASSLGQAQGRHARLCALLYTTRRTGPHVHSSLPAAARVCRAYLLPLEHCLPFCVV